MLCPDHSFSNDEWNKLFSVDTLQLKYLKFIYLINEDYLAPYKVFLYFSEFIFHDLVKMLSCSLWKTNTIRNLML